MKLTSDYERLISQAYQELLSSRKDPKETWPNIKKRLDPWFDTIRHICIPPFDKDAAIAISSVANQIAELSLLDLVCTEASQQSERLSILLNITKRLLDYGGKPAENLATAFFEKFIVGLDALPLDCAQDIINTLGDIVEEETGTLGQRVEHAPERLSSAIRLKLYDLLNVALYAEVIGFCQERRMRRVQKEHAELLSLINKKCQVISVFSRKGGTGKTTILMAISSWFLKRNPNKKICVLDLDLSGPVWQYLLLKKRGKSDNFLDKLLDTKQPVDFFDFGWPSSESVMNLVDSAKCSFAHGKAINHLGLRDSPRCNRLIKQAAERNKEDFYPFLIKVVSALSDNHDVVLIDNAPGFDGIPNCVLSLTGAAPSGLPLIISTPAFPDLAGTFLELADLRLLGFSQRAVWVVNKTTESSKEFFKIKRTPIKVASSLQAYKGSIPNAPLVNKILQPVEVTKTIWQILPMDPELFDFNFVKAAGPSETPDLTSNVFKLVDSVYLLMDKVLGEKI